MDTITQRFQRFMQGRNGPDQLGQFVQIITVIVMILGIIFHLPGLYWLWIIGFGYGIFRMFSKRGRNKRIQENQHFLNIRYRIIGRFNLWKKHMREHKTHRFYTCSNCHQKIRVPKGKGKISITCPSCKNEFIKKT